MTSNSTEARKLIKQGKIRKIMWDTGATASIVGLDHEDMINDIRPSRKWLRHYHGYYYTQTIPKLFVLYPNYTQRCRRKVDGMPHIKVINPYGSSKKTPHFEAGVSFPAPVGGEWDDMCLLGA